MTNRLIEEISPYLLQHAHNPVDWFPWGEEAFHLARKKNVPVFLSIGYAACHWCHVMERESFEDESTAAYLNSHFLCIKVDREERPDLDSIYMQAVVEITGQGGWPLSVFLTPQGVPFWGGTYFPKTPRHGMPSFLQVLQIVSERWDNEPNRMVQLADTLHRQIQEAQRMMPVEKRNPDAKTAAAAARQLSRDFDAVNGGWGTAPKFPQPMTLDFLLSRYQHTQETDLLSMVDRTLTRMAEGGIYDQIGGGFHRYSTDAGWQVPHFEKMLYDNALLVRTYLHAWQITGNPLFRRVVTGILDYVTREMIHPRGGFFSTQDADSEGVEGKFFLWSHSEIQEILREEADLFRRYYGVTEEGNFERSNILHISLSQELAAERMGLSPRAWADRLDRSIRRLFLAREKRTPCNRDEKIIASWNGLMLAAFAEAGRVLDREDYRQTAVRNAQFLLQELRSPDRRLYRIWKDGSGPRGKAYLEDYVYLAAGILELYRTTFLSDWFVEARYLMETAVRHFSSASGMFYDTADDHETPLLRPISLQDNALPSGNAVAAAVFQQLAAYSKEVRYREQAERMLGQMQDLVRMYPNSFGAWLTALELYGGDIEEIAIVGIPEDPNTQALLRVAQDGFHPGRIIACKRPGENPPIPLLHRQEMVGGKATAFVCRQCNCLYPTTEPEELKRQLSEGKSDPVNSGGCFQ